MSVEYGIITAVIPPSGWHYLQELPTGGIHRITGFSFEELLANMLEFRTHHPELAGGNQNANIDAVRRDLKAYICAHFAQNCADSKSPPVQTHSIPVRNYVRPIDRATNWLASRAKARIDLVDLGLATARAEVCIGCQQNVGWQTGCAPCNDQVAIRTQHLKGNQHTQFDQRLRMCRVFGWINEVAVWLTDQQAAPDRAPPAHCWRLKEQNVRAST